MQERGLEEVTGSVYVALGAASAARGEHEEALRLLECGTVLLRAGGHPAPLAHVLIRQAAVLEAMGRSDAAAAAVDEARAAVDACAHSPLLTERLAALERPRRRRRNGAPLSERELAILRMLGGTLSERDIGRELYLSHNTVHSHTRSIYRKLGVSSRAEAVERARSIGLL
jgi:ATP/maltotriose-dependent transcriptional regulator MalT